jgi:hypothetical protein
MLAVYQPGRQLRHDPLTLLLAEAAPAGDFGQRAPAADAKAGLTTDGADLDAGRGDWRRRHRARAKPLDLAGQSLVPWAVSNFDKFTLTLDVAYRRSILA